MKTLLKRLALSLCLGTTLQAQITPPPIAEQTTTELIRSFNTRESSIGYVQWWEQPAVAARATELGSALQSAATARLAAGDKYAGHELYLLEMWWRTSGKEQSMLPTAKVAVKLGVLTDPKFAAIGFARFITTNEDYVALKAANFVYEGVDLRASVPGLVAQLAYKNGDFAQIDGMNRGSAISDRFTAKEYAAYLTWKSQFVTSDLQRYGFLQAELDNVGLAAPSKEQAEIVVLIQKASDITYLRIKRAKELAAP